MASFTRFYKKSSLTLALLFACTYLFAASTLQVKTAELTQREEFYSLDANIDVRFDKDIEEAINKGVPLSFLVEFQIVSPREYWFDDEIVTQTQSVVLSYHALSRQYLVTRSEHQLSFETLNEAAKELGNLQDWKVVESSLIEKGEPYKAALLIRLDKTKLPKAIQVDTLATEKWNLVSQKIEWAFKEQK
jgi:Domain of unknown function (DUF4390)